MKTKRFDWFILNLYLLVQLYISFVLRSSHYYMMNSPLVEYIKAMTNLVPFATIGKYAAAIFTHSMNLSIPLINLFGNLLLFMPFPYLIRRINNGINTKSLLVITLQVILSFELLQVITRCGSFDIDDIILNMGGAALVCFLMNVYSKR